MRFFNATLMQKTNYYRQVIRDFPLDAVLVGWFYDVDNQRRIRRFKFVHNTVDSVYFESIFRELLAENPIKEKENIVIVYPPISLKDRIFRGPNHAKRLAKIFANILGIRQIVCPFKKKFFAGHQSDRNKQQRREIQSEYSLHHPASMQLQGKDIILIDDIITTGYTAHTLGILLRTAWVKWITGFFLASQKI